MYLKAESEPLNCDLTDWCYKNWVATSRKTASETLIMMHRKFRLEVTNILNITRYAIKNECLIPWVKFFWHIEAVNADIHYKLLPTDCIDVILNLADVIVYETEMSKTCYGIEDSLKDL